MSKAEARMEEVVLMLKVSWPSPPVPTISHCKDLAIVRYSGN
jgi:hypothetical protein